MQAELNKIITSSMNSILLCRRESDIYLKSKDILEAYNLFRQDVEHDLEVFFINRETNERIAFESIPNLFDNMGLDNRAALQLCQLKNYYLQGYKKFDSDNPVSIYLLEILRIDNKLESYIEDFVISCLLHNLYGVEGKYLPAEKKDRIISTVQKFMNKSISLTVDERSDLGDLYCLFDAIRKLIHHSDAKNRLRGRNIIDFVDIKLDLVSMMCLGLDGIVGDNVDNSAKILVIGETGVGKSTTINYINGIEYREHQSGVTNVLARVNYMATFLVAPEGYGFLSKTIYSNCYGRFIDTAGSSDTRVGDAAIYAAISPALAVHHAGQLAGIMLVLSYDVMFEGIANGNFFPSISDSVTKMLGEETIRGYMDKSKYPVCPLVFVFTRPRITQLINEEDHDAFRTIILANVEQYFMPNVESHKESDNILLRLLFMRQDNLFFITGFPVSLRSADPNVPDRVLVDHREKIIQYIEELDNSKMYLSKDNFVYKSEDVKYANFMKRMHSHINDWNQSFKSYFVYSKKIVYYEKIVKNAMDGLGYCFGKLSLIFQNNLQEPAQYLQMRMIPEEESIIKHRTFRNFFVPFYSMLQNIVDYEVFHKKFMLSYDHMRSIVAVIPVFEDLRTMSNIINFQRYYQRYLDFRQNHEQKLKNSWVNIVRNIITIANNNMLIMYKFLRNAIVREDAIMHSSHDSVLPLLYDQIVFTDICNRLGDNQQIGNLRNTFFVLPTYGEENKSNQAVILSYLMLSEDLKDFKVRFSYLFGDDCFLKEYYDLFRCYDPYNEQLISFLGNAVFCSKFVDRVCRSFSNDELLDIDQVRKKLSEPLWLINKSMREHMEKYYKINIVIIDNDMDNITMVSDKLYISQDISVLLPREIFLKTKTFSIFLTDINSGSSEMAGSQYAEQSDDAHIDNNSAELVLVFSECKINTEMDDNDQQCDGTRYAAALN